MKTDNRNFVFSWFNTLLVAAVIGFLTVWAVKAENNIDFDVVDGLFTPTQADLFFEVGRGKIEREVEIFNHPERYLSDDLLKIDPEIIEQMDRSRKLPDFSQENAPFRLFIDADN